MVPLTDDSRADGGSLQLSDLPPHHQRTQARGASGPGRLVRRALRVDLSRQLTEAWPPQSECL